MSVATGAPEAAVTAALARLVAGVAHELNTPLGALHGNHDVLRRALNRLQAILADEVVEPSELEEVRRIVRALDGILTVNDLAVARMVALVADLRSFGRPDRSEIDRVDLAAALDSTIALLGHELPDRIRIVRDYAPLPPVECFPARLNQVFMNLVLNAAQAIPADGTITISARAGAGEGAGGADEVSVEIADTGVGIQPADLERIFEPGFTTKGPRMGMGLGLLIARRIVGYHGGSITVDSEPGRGTRFVVTLPVRLTVATPNARPEPEAVARGS